MLTLLHNVYAWCVFEESLGLCRGYYVIIDCTLRLFCFSVTFCVREG